jgi:alpha-mannosidase
MPRDKEDFPNGWNRREFIAALTAAAIAGNIRAGAVAAKPREVFLVPNFHPASCGWLTTFSKERIYCANSYLNHLDRVRDDPNYSFVMSEVNNIIAIMDFQPSRVPELKRRVQEKRVELVNGYFLESAINLSGGEALVRQGVEGLRWYQKMFGVRPRFSWSIDVCGTHDQMPQIAAGLGLEALAYTRRNPTGKTLYWSESPDGTRILTISPGHYSEAHPIFSSKSVLTKDQLHELETFFGEKEPITPEGAPLLVLGGGDDYALAPLVKEYPSLLLKQLAETDSERRLKFATLSQYLDAIQPGINSGSTRIPTMRGGTAYDFDAFWIENPRVKTLYRRNEHALQAAETLATIASLHGRYEYPVKPLSDCWILMCLNMDRNTIWGSAGGMVFENNKSWDVQDRFNWVAKTTAQVFDSAANSLTGNGDQVTVFNPLNWKRNDPIALQLPAGKNLRGAPSEAMPNGLVLCRLDMPSTSVGGWKLSSRAPAVPRSIELPQVIETNYYLASIDPRTGALVSLKLRKSGRELLAAPANVIVAERPATKQTDDPGDKMPPRPERTRLATSSDQSSAIKATRGALATAVEINGTFYGGGAVRRVIRFYHDHPRIDFETELNDIPNYTIVVSEFPLSEDVLEVRRAIPYGFSHGAWSKPNDVLHGWTKGIVPAVRWIDFSLANGGGLAIFDRGLSGRELNGRTPIIYLLNAEDKYVGYENPWLSGKGKHTLPYSIVAHESTWHQARIPHLAWEYNQAPVVISGGTVTPLQSFLETSENVIAEASRREGDHIELRLVECLGLAGTARVKMNLPHKGAALADLTGRKLSDLPGSSPYTFAVRPQQIVTMHFTTTSGLPEPEPIISWDSFVPEEKLSALHDYDPTLIGHPPFGT